MPSIMEEHAPSLKQPLACCWTLGGTECLLMKSELPTKSQELSNSPNHKVK